MAKLDLNEVTREELVDVAGLRPAVAEAVLKARDEHGGGIADIGALKDALGEVRGIGPATLDQLGDHLKVGRQPAGPAAAKAAEAAPAPKVARQAMEEEAAEAPAPGVKVARQPEEKTAEAEAPAPGPKVARQAEEEAAEVPALSVRAAAVEARRTVERTAEVASLAARRGVEAAGRAATERSGEAVRGLGQLVARLVDEQVRANLETMRGLARARTWREALEVQHEFFSGNVARMIEGTGRYAETMTRLTAGLAEVGRGGRDGAA
jgi:hypothetical protein